MWQPIATAPLDGTWVLVSSASWTGNGDLSPHATVAQHHAEDGWRDETGELNDLAPTHWMPLPEPPPKET